MTTTNSKNETGAKVRRSSRVRNASASGKQVKNASLLALGAKIEEKKQAALSAVADGVATSRDFAVAVSSGAASSVALPAKSGGACSLACAALMDSEDVKVRDLSAKILRHFSAPRFEDSEEYTLTAQAVASLPNDIKERALRGAALAWSARPENSAPACSLSLVLSCISEHYQKEFSAVVGAPLSALGGADGVRLWVRSALNLSTISADSSIKDYVCASPVPSGLSASGLVGVVLSYRNYMEVARAIEAAKVRARGDLFASLESVARAALRLGVGLDEITGRLNKIMETVPTTNEIEKKRLSRNLASCWASLKQIECALILAGLDGIEIDGGFVFSASLPASASAKVRKLWAKRVRLLSSVATLEALLKMA